MRSHQHSLMGLKIQASQAPPINGLSILSMSHCEISFIVLIWNCLIEALQRIFFEGCLNGAVIFSWIRPWSTLQTVML